MELKGLSLPRLEDKPINRRKTGICCGSGKQKPRKQFLHDRVRGLRRKLYQNRRKPIRHTKYGCYRTGRSYRWAEWTFYRRHNEDRNAVPGRRDCRAVR